MRRLPQAATDQVQHRRLQRRDRHPRRHAVEAVAVNKGDGKQPDLVITLFDRTAIHTYLARTGLLGGDFPNHNDIYTPVPNQPHDLTGDAKSFQLSFESPVKGGVKVVKTYTFTRGSYVIGVDTKIENVGTDAGHAVGLYGTGARRPAGGNAALLAHVHRTGCLHGPAPLPEDDVQRHRQEQGRLRDLGRQRLDRDGAALLRDGVDSAARRRSATSTSRRSIRRCIASA